MIVGSNGSGKSTVLKLILRLYDPTEGEILIDDKDIKELKLADLRECVSVLFQDYTHFPLSVSSSSCIYPLPSDSPQIGDNIALGSPQCAHDSDKVREAARLGGAEGFVDKLPEGFDTYLDRPVRDYYSGIPDGTKSLFGKPVNFGGIGKAMGVPKNSNSVHLSGGQMQRLAVYVFWPCFFPYTESLSRSRSFMRSLLSEGQSIGLLLFDEPSAALDPTAEHGADDGRLLVMSILIYGLCVRSFRAAEKLERAKDHDFLLSQIWSTHAPRGPDSVRSKSS